MKTGPNATLQWTLAQINDWLKFAEAKNAALVAASVALMAGSGFLDKVPALYGSLFVGYLISAGVVGALSFLPFTEIPPMRPRAHRADSDNLIFFGDIEKYTGRFYLEAMKTKGVILSESPLDIEISGQIVINSRIASWKYSCFRLGLWLALSAAITPFVSIPLLLCLAARHKHGA